MTERIAAGLYRIPVPLPGNPLRELNSYLLTGGGRSLLIDTGFRQEACRQALFAGLAELGVDRREVDVALTHLHSDHAGLAPAPTDRYRTLAPGQVLEAGARRLRCLSVPGHTPGQLCFWDEEEGILFTGDHVLFDISPNITSWLGMEDALGSYLDSLRAVRDLPARLALPGHWGRGERAPRVDALLAHHARRLEELRGILRSHPDLTAYQAAGRMRWRIRAAGWDDFPLAQKWFAVGECVAHLDYLRLRGLAARSRDGGVWRYRPA